jgi:hypothetical protein
MSITRTADLPDVPTGYRDALPAACPDVFDRGANGPYDIEELLSHPERGSHCLNAESPASNILHGGMPPW